jgi:hypothetical protein
MHRLFAPEPLKRQCNSRFPGFGDPFNGKHANRRLPQQMLQQNRSIYAAEVEQSEDRPAFYKKSLVISIPYK